MKNIALTIGTLFLFLFSVHTLGGVTLGDLGPGVTTPNPVAQPNSKAHGRSLDAWVEAYVRSLLEDAAAPKKNVTFLPIFGELPSDNVFEVEVKPGTALVLPIALWLGFPGDPVLGVNNFSSAVTLDGLPIAVPNEDYYVGPTNLVPPIIFGEDTVAFYEGLAVVIKPLTPGEHTIHLSSAITIPLGDGTNFVAEFSNKWNITVFPHGTAR